MGYAASGGNGRLNDLWRFTITSKKWAWMSGNNTINQKGVYGEKGVLDITNYPGARYASVSWMDTDGNLWLFGGSGYNESAGPGRLNDLWRFTITSKKWAWMSGNNTIDEYGVYGEKGVPDITNYPGGRDSSVSWKDTDGNLRLFGGRGYAASGDNGLLNDLWRFGCFEESQPYWQIPSTDDDDNDQPTTPSGDFILLLIVVGIVGVVIYLVYKILKENLS
ncbi:MAG: hypothetical protein EU548_00525 [Promethearchaeota archaeon]|nr:MAG: hypothetical protein EU548_00525 [Candidatus Lokiarchaeota archaeon]